MEKMKVVAKEEVFDRFGQSVELFMKNFIGLFLPLFIYGVGIIILFTTITNYLLNLFKELINKEENSPYFERINEIYQNPTLVNNNEFINKIIEELGIKNFPNIINYLPEILYGIGLFILFLIIVAIFYIPFGLATIKGIKQGYNGKKVCAKDNIVYGLKNILNSFKTYWYLFVYVFLIPALIFIVGGLILNYGLFNNDENLTGIGTWIIGLSFFVYILFAIYRGIKSSFYMSSAIDKNEFSKENFKYSIKVTEENWWRILGNFILIGLIIGFLVVIINNILSSIIGASINQETNILDNSDIKNTLNLIIESYSMTYDIISKIILQAIETIGAVFILTFTYIFFKRLEIEKEGEEKANSIKDTN